ncbi:MAG TPA: hypothetical protein DGR27_03590 [Eubacterium sp.]|nr:hypothetical protein [Eubacterium sp.]HCW37584.1 hypothetical protein [Eubacterium sp.]
MDNCKYRHILFLSYKDICYNSTSYFEQRISEELINAGIKVTHLNIPKPAKGLSGTLADTAYMLLKPYFNADLDAIIDINTTIPCIKYNNGYILNNFDIPVWHYILDHPLYHYKALKVQLNNYNVICLDTFHAKLIRESFPHIREVKVIPLSADEYSISNISKKYCQDNMADTNSDSSYNTLSYHKCSKRAVKLLFTSTYTDPVKVALLYNKSGLNIQNNNINDKDINDNSTKNTLIKDIDNDYLLNALLNNPSFTQEKAVQYLRSLNILDNSSSTIQYLHNNFLIDVYLQCIIREEIVSTTIKNRIPITIYGHGWDAFVDKCDILIPEYTKYLDIRKEVTYNRLPAIYSNARLSLNQMPWFKGGMHDRIPLALMNGCLSLTDASTYLTDVLNIGENEGVYTYSLENIEAVPDIIMDILNNTADDNCVPEIINSLSDKDCVLENINSLSDNARAYAHKHFSWKCWVDKFLD